MMMSTQRWTHWLDGSVAPAKERIGGKAWSLARMRALGLNVPPAFVITTEACQAWFAAGRSWPEGLEQELVQGIDFLQNASGRRFGGATQALLVSVRSGAAISMPGMMDTVLNLGMNDEAELALAAESGSAAFAADTHRRFCELYGRIVLKAAPPEHASADRIRLAVFQEVGEPIPQDPVEQLRRAVVAVFESSRSRRALAYRKHQGLPADLPTAVTVQAMVFGNLGQESGTGVMFSRNPLTGAPQPYGEYLAHAQGEDVVSGTRTPEPLDALREQFPALHAQLLEGARVLEREERDMQDIEFTVERGRLYFLQSRAAKRSPEAAIRTAVDLAQEGLITREQALARVNADQVDAVLRPRLVEAEAQRARVLARGEPASPGIAAGLVVDDCEASERLEQAGEAAVLCRVTTSPEDVHGMIASVAVVTEQGGSTSHAAVVGRQLGKPCVVGCGEGTVATLRGQTVTVDGDRGLVYAGRVPTEVPRETDHPYLAQLAAWTGGVPLREALAASTRAP